MRQDETIASSRFWPKIDFSEEKCHGRNDQNISEPLDFKIFRGGGGHAKLASPCSDGMGSKLQKSAVFSNRYNINFCLFVVLN